MRVEGLRWPATSWRFAGWSRPALACAVGYRCCWSFSATGRDMQPTKRPAPLSLRTPAVMEWDSRTGERRFIPPERPSNKMSLSLPLRRRAFPGLHEQGCFVIPNPWDLGSARYLQHLGFPALATTSAGFAFSQGLPDSGDDDVLARDRNLSYIASIAAAVDLPVNADFMSGYGITP